MRFLADENFPKYTVEKLRGAGHDVVWVRTDYPGAQDAWLLDLAESEGRLLLTFDKDFWQLAIQRRSPTERSGIILVRVHPATPKNITPLVLRTMSVEREWKGYAIVISENHILMVRLRAAGIETP